MGIDLVPLDPKTMKNVGSRPQIYGSSHGKGYIPMLRRFTIPFYINLH